MDLKIDDRDYELWLLLARTHYHVKQARTRELHRYGISPEQAGILFYVHNCGNNAIPADISRWMIREPQTITSILNRMLKKGLIDKKQDAERKNVIRISLTPKGLEVLKHAEKRYSFHRILSTLTEEKRQALHDILDELRNAALKLNRSISGLEEHI